MTIYGNPQWTPLIHFFIFFLQDPIDPQKIRWGPLRGGGFRWHGSHGGPALVPQRGTGQAADPAAGDGGDPDLLHLRRDQGGRGETAKDRALALRLVIVCDSSNAVKTIQN